MREGREEKRKRRREGGKTKREPTDLRALESYHNTRS